MDLFPAGGAGDLTEFSSNGGSLSTTGVPFLAADDIGVPVPNKFCGVMVTEEARDEDAAVEDVGVWLWKEAGVLMELP